MRCFFPFNSLSRLSPPSCGGLFVSMLDGNFLLLGNRVYIPSVCPPRPLPGLSSGCERSPNSGLFAHTRCTRDFGLRKLPPLVALSFLTGDFFLPPSSPTDPNSRTAGPSTSCWSFRVVAMVFPRPFFFSGSEFVFSLLGVRFRKSSLPSRFYLPIRPFLPRFPFAVLPPFLWSRALLKPVLANGLFSLSSCP